MNQILTGGVSQNVTGASLLSGEITSSDLSNSDIARNKKDMAKALKNLEAPQDNNGKGNKNRKKNTGPMVEQYEVFIRKIEVQKNRAKISSIKSAIDDLMLQYIEFAPGLSGGRLDILEKTILSKVLGLVDSRRHVAGGLPSGYVAGEVSNESKSIVDPKQQAIQNAILDYAENLGFELADGEVRGLLIEAIMERFSISKDDVEAIGAIKGYINCACELIFMETPPEVNNRSTSVTTGGK